MNRTKKLVLAAGLTLLGGTAAFGENARGYFNNWADDRPLTGTTGQYMVFGTTEPPHAELSVEVTKFHQSYPYSGKATVEYTVAGTLPADAVAQIVINTDDAGAIFVQSNIVAGANSNVIDFASSFGGALLLTNASFVVTIAEGAGGGSSGGTGGV